MPKGLQTLHSMRMPMRRSVVSRSTTCFLSIHTSIRLLVTRIRNRYHLSRVNSTSLRVSTRDGVAPGKQKPPLKWSETENVLWKTPVPGRGHGSPTVVGNHVYLATAEEASETQSVLCFDRKTGKQLWQTEIHRGGFATKLHFVRMRYYSTSI
jgi:PQQ-like domain